MRTKHIIFILFILGHFFAIAKKWDALYINKLLAQKEYDKIINYYKDLYDDINNPQPELAFKIADLYAKKKDYNSAIYWYKKETHLLKESKVNLLNMANTYKIMGDYQKALDTYLTYAAETGDASKILNDAYLCEKLIRANSFQENYIIENYTFNTPADEINISTLRKNIMYLQYINDEESKNSKKINTQTFLQAQRVYDRWNEPKRIVNLAEKDRIYSKFSFSKDGNKVVFSLKTKLSPTDSKIKTMQSETEKIYIANFLGGNIINIIPFSYNTENYNCAQPCFNEDGTSIYFISNMIGGMGGNDIYKSDYDNGKWSKPLNLGKLINTKENEQNPFYLKDKGKEYLYFSSNRPGGFGNYDVYKAEFANNIWQDVELLHAPINSPNDENSYIFDFETQTGYVSSDRPNGKGGFDIYRILPFNLNIVVALQDSTNSEEIEYAYLELFEGNTKINDGVTNTNGIGKVQVSKNKNYTLNITKDGYQPKTVKINTYNKLNGDSIFVSEKLILNNNYSLKNSVLSSSNTNYILFSGNFTDGSTNKIVQAKAKIINLNTNKIRTIDYDTKGNFNIKLMTNNNYSIIIENNGLKIKDEITTYGLEHGSVKIKNYILSGTKFKTTENRILKPNLVDDSIKIAYFQEKTTLPAKTLKSDNNQIAETNTSNTEIKKYNNSNIDNILSEKNITTANTDKTITKNITLFDLDEELEIDEEEEIYTQKENPFYYKVQIGSYTDANVNMEKIKNFGKIETTNSYNQYIYRLGNYYTKEEALNILNAVRNEGYYLAFILQYINDNIIGIIK